MKVRTLAKLIGIIPLKRRLHLLASGVAIVVLLTAFFGAIPNEVSASDGSAQIDVHEVTQQLDLESGRPRVTLLETGFATAHDRVLVYDGGRLRRPY